jgi:hypothetical protein
VNLYSKRARTLSYYPQRNVRADPPGTHHYRARSNANVNASTTRFQSRLTIGGNDGSAPAVALVAMDEYDSTRVQRLADELTRRRQVDQKIGVVDVLDRDAHVDDARLWVVGRDLIGAYRQDVRYATLRRGPRGYSGRDAGGLTGNVSASVKTCRASTTHFPK